MLIFSHGEDTIVSFYPGLVSCPSDYRRNPYSNTCIRLVKSAKNWYEAKSYCERYGEYFATFATILDATWLRIQQQEGWLPTNNVLTQRIAEKGSERSDRFFP